MARRIHIAGLSARPRYSKSTKTTEARTPAPGSETPAASPPADQGFAVRLAGLKHEFSEADFAVIALNAARQAAEQQIELDMEGLLEAARDFRGEIAETTRVREDAGEDIKDTPMDFDDDEILMQSPSVEDVLDED